MSSAKSQQDQGDRRYMAMALMLARRGWGVSAPNPSVGAVIVAGNGARAEVLGRGWTQPGGRPHAETEALARAGERARGAMLYVTLEPCAHHGRTPPCADAVIAAGISRVVIGARDPDSRVAGQGIARLRQAGIKLAEGVLADDAKWTTAGHILRVRHGRPFVQLKLAVSADGKIAPGTGSEPVWVTGRQARAQGHLLRARADVILVGIGTVLADDPQLDCRLPGLAEQSPGRAVLDRALRLPPTAKLLKQRRQNRPAVLVFTTKSAAEERVNALSAAGAGYCHAPGQDGGSSTEPADVLAFLARRGVTRVLIEGGPTVAAAFIDAGAVDEAVIFQGSGVLGETGMTPLASRGTEIFDNAAHWLRAESRNLPDGDVMTVYQSRATLDKL